MCKKDIYKSHRDEIDIMLNSVNVNYIECLKKTYDFLHMIENEETDEKNFRFAYGTLSRIYNNLGDKKRALNNVLKAEKYLKNSLITDKIMIYWQIGMSYKGINNTKALEYFGYCFSEGRKINAYGTMGGVLDEIAMIEENIDDMLLAIKLHKQWETANLIKKQKDLDDMHSHLFQLYMNKNLKGEAMNVLLNIKDKNLVHSLKLKAFKYA